MRDSNPKHPKTLWTEMVIPAKGGSAKHIEALFRSYTEMIDSVIKCYMPNATPEALNDLRQTFIEACIRRDFLKSVERPVEPAKGGFRAFIWTCVKRFVIDHTRRKKEPAEKAEYIIDVGGEEDGSIQLSDSESHGLQRLDEGWALQTEKMALDHVFENTSLSSISEQLRRSLRNRLMALQDNETTLKSDAIAIMIPESRYNNLYYSAKKEYAKAIVKELGRQVDAKDLEDEKQHLIHVLSGIRSRHTNDT